MLAGGGVRGGYVHGASDATATEVDEKSTGPEDLARTVFTLLGIDPDRRLMSPGNRPVKIVAGGQIINEVLA